jgi:hypothetical protein
MIPEMRVEKNLSVDIGDYSSDRIEMWEEGILLIGLVVLQGRVPGR